MLVAADGCRYKHGWQATLSNANRFPCRTNRRVTHQCNSDTHMDTEQAASTTAVARHADLSALGLPRVLAVLSLTGK